MARGIRRGIVSDRVIASFALAAAAAVFGLFALGFVLRVDLRLRGEGIAYADSLCGIVAEIQMDVSGLSSIIPGQRALLIAGNGDVFSGKVISRSVGSGPGSGKPVLVVRVGEIDVEGRRRLLQLIRGRGEVPVKGEVAISRRKRFIELVIGAAFRRPPPGGR